MVSTKYATISKLLLIFSILLLILSAMPLAALAQTSKTAKIYFLPTTGSLEVGETFDLRAVVNTEDQYINAIEDIISYSNDTLEVTRIDKSGTIIMLWVKEPLYDNSTGKLTFAGGVPNPGFQGLGRIFRIYFKAKAVGNAWVTFSSSAQVLANDGLGTNIFSSAGRSDLIIRERVTPAPVPVKPPTVAPIILVVSSSSHPDQDQWYVEKDIIFSWKWQRGIISYSYSISQNPKDIPDNIGEGVDTSISYLEVKDGVWYFHIKPRTRAGWGKTVHYQVQIDSVAPTDLEITSLEDFPTIKPSPTFQFKAKDETSGVDHAQVKLDDLEFIRLDQLEYQPLSLSPGEHQIIVRVMDKAGNFVEDSYTFEVLSLSAPRVDFWTKKIIFGEPFIARGKAVPNNKISLTIFTDQEEEELRLITTSDIEGIWLIESRDVLKKGTYKFTVKQETAAGVVSSASKENIFKVLTNAFKILGIVLPAIVLFWLIIFLSAIIAILLTFIVFLYRPDFFTKVLLKKILFKIRKVK